MNEIIPINNDTMLVIVQVSASIQVDIDPGKISNKPNDSEILRQLYDILDSGQITLVLPHTKDQTDTSIITDVGNQIFGKAQIVNYKVTETELIQDNDLICCNQDGDTW